VALQGTIDTFPLTDVLHLLSTSAKTGRLVLDGDRGRRTLWIDRGRVVGGGPEEVPPGTAASLVFQMLRFRQGSFTFDQTSGDVVADVPVEPCHIGECLEVAAGLIESWSSIESVVPSTAHRVVMSLTLPSDSVTVDRSTWQVLRGAGAERTVAEISAAAGLDEYDGSAAVAALVSRGLVRIGEPVRPPVSTASDQPRGRESTDPVRADESAPATPGFPDRFPIDDLIGSGEDAGADPWSAIELERNDTDRQPDQAPSADQTLPPPLSMSADATPDQSWDSLIDDALDGVGNGRVDVGPPSGASGRPERPSDGDGVDPDPGRSAADDSTDEVLRQMSRLSPQAAEAIAAALNSPSDGRPEGPTEASL
jgi:hypothetical protein